MTPEPLHIREGVAEADLPARWRCSCGESGGTRHPNMESLRKGWRLHAEYDQMSGPVYSRTRTPAGA